jgi:hypothetical protein
MQSLLHPELVHTISLDKALNAPIESRAEDQRRRVSPVRRHVRFVAVIGWKARCDVAQFSRTRAGPVRRTFLSLATQTTRSDYAFLPTTISSRARAALVTGVATAGLLAASGPATAATAQTRSLARIHPTHIVAQKRSVAATHLAAQKRARKN